MEKLSFEMPSVIHINDDYYLGIINEEKNCIEKCWKAGDAFSGKEDFPNYLKELNVENCATLKIKNNQNIIVRSLDRNEELLWKNLIDKLNYVSEVAIKVLINNYFSSYVSSGNFTK
jgi:hypothetical protein